MSWIITIFGIVMLVLLHELGHFVAAKRLGMRVERFSVFFPPLIARHKVGETEYAIGAIPAGGYVKITGMSPEECAQLPPELQARAYYNQAPWKRIVVILAGPGVNILIAFVLFWAVLYSGSLDGAVALQNANPTLGALTPTTKVAELVKGKPAAEKLKLGDRIVSVSGKPASTATAINAIGATHCAAAPTQGCRATTPVTLAIKGPGGSRTVELYPRYDDQTKRMMIGVGFGTKLKPFGFLAAGVAAAGEMAHITVEALAGLGRALTSPKARSQVHSIIGISEVTNEAVAIGAGYALVLLGFVSLVLGVLNLLPFLPLDGGHVLWALAEKIRGKRISVVAMYRFSSVGIVLLLFLVINGVANDIGHLAG
jgi:regulator of sigma E protease